MGWSLLLALVWAWGFYLAVRAIHDGRTSQGTLSWVLLLVLLPPLAVPLYMMWGERRLEGYIRARRGGWRKLDKEFKRTLEALRPFHAAPTDPTLAVLEPLANLPWTRSNSVVMYSKAEAMYAAMLSDIAAARESALLQFYIYRDDDIGRRVRDALVAAAARGVKVYVMYDEIGSLDTPTAYFDSLRQAGVEVSGFRTVPNRRRLLRLNFRNHRKLVVIDGERAYFGGMNVGDEYLGKDDAIGRWRDTHARITGPAALAAQFVFCEDWHWARRDVPHGIRWDVTTADEVPAARTESDVERALMYPSGPVDDREAGVLLVLQLLSRARSRIWIATPYFVCEEAVIQSLVLAKMRGVDVRVIVPTKPDSILVNLASKSYVRDCVAAHIPVFHYGDGFSHQKVLVCDEVASIGSANLDHRSMKLNFELTGVVQDMAFADRVVRMLERDVERSERVPDTWWETLSSWERFKVRAARMAAPLL